MTKNQRADDVGDNVVEDEVRGERFTCMNVTQDLMQNCRFWTAFKIYVNMPVLSTFVATEDFGAVCELIDNDRFEGLLAKSEQSEG